MLCRLCQRHKTKISTITHLFGTLLRVFLFVKMPLDVMLTVINIKTVELESNRVAAERDGGIA